MTNEERHARDASIAKRMLIVDQREANAHMVSTTIRAQELTERAEAALALAEAKTVELRQSEERYRTLFDLCPAAVYSCDASGAIRQVNRHAAELWGREPALEAIDELFCGALKLFRPDGSFLPREQCPMAEVLSGRVSEVRDAELMIERPDGSRVTVLVNVRSLKDAGGEVTGAIDCSYDISARKRTEEALRETAELRELFVGILGHDLRNPLSAVLMASTLMLDRGNLDRDDAELATRIVRSGQRIERMNTQLLDFTRARRGGTFPIEPRRADLFEICRDVVSEFEAPIQLEVEGELRGTWDPDRLAQVLSNLVGNAIDHATPGTVVTVKARADGADVVVAVSNHGAPIAAEMLPFVFDAFRGGRQRVTSEPRNLGLGLYIAHQIVLAHGGTLDARSADGTTSFVMRLPRGIVGAAPVA